ncbi:hypothetical protein EI94DRAFT_1819044 [Lactarius quietus]|nr:hypothetical protein EI94DRAFT_1819044 [Lactarius quietus]
MPSSVPAFGDTVCPDGTLKDASEMEWPYDADEGIPYPSSKASHSRAHSSSSPTPAETVASVCWMTRISHPSWCVREEAESAPSAAATSMHPPKCSAPHGSSDCRPTKKSVINVDNGDSDDSGDSNGGTTTEPATELASDDFKVLKAMADADNLAATFKTKADCTADICLMFHCETGYVHPETGKILDGHWCTTCQDDPTVKRTLCFLTGSTTLLWMHIARSVALQLSSRRIPTQFLVQELI